MSSVIYVTISSYLFHVGLSASICAQAMWQCMELWIKVRKSAHIDLVDFGPPDRDQMHVINSMPSITLVKSNDNNLILHSANRGVTRGCLWMH